MVLTGRSGPADSSLKGNPLIYSESKNNSNGTTYLPGILGAKRASKDRPLPFVFYDSATTSDNNIYVIFHDAQAIPKYVIEFKDK